MDAGVVVTTTAEREQEANAPETYHFDLVFRRRVKSVDYTMDRIKNRLQLLMSFEENEREFWGGVKELQPILHVVRSEPFLAF